MSSARPEKLAIYENIGSISQRILAFLTHKKNRCQLIADISKLRKINKDIKLTVFEDELNTLHQCEKQGDQVHKLWLQVWLSFLKDNPWKHQSAPSIIIKSIIAKFVDFDQEITRDSLNLIKKSFISRAMQTLENFEREVAKLEETNLSPRAEPKKLDMSEYTKIADHISKNKPVEVSEQRNTNKLDFDKGWLGSFKQNLEIIVAKRKPIVPDEKPKEQIVAQTVTIAASFFTQADEDQVKNAKARINTFLAEKLQLRIK